VARDLYQQCDEKHLHRQLAVGLKSKFLI
jgi:hypothetical protein